MEIRFWAVVGGMALCIIALLVKIYLLQKSADEIACAFADRLTTDTNMLIDISSGDKHMRSLANTVNTQLRVLRRERQRFQQGDLEHKNAVTNISHDLRTPLTAICAYLDLMEHEEINEKVRRYLMQLQNRAEVLKGLTEELFRYSVVAYSHELKVEQVNVVSVLEESLLSFYGMMQESGIQPQLSLPEEAIRRNLDVSALNRIFSNIISNALKYSDGDFSVEMRENGTIIFSNMAKALNPLIVAKLFDRFYTVEVNRNSTGLGLSIAKLLTERMGGRISADYCDGRLSVMVQFNG